MLMRGEAAGPSHRSHTPQCRKRIEEEMAKSAILKQRLEAATERQERWLASEVEKGSTQSREGEAPSGTQTAEDKTRQEEVIDRGPEEDGIPEVGEEDAEGVERPTKKARTGSMREEAVAEESEVIGGSAAEGEGNAHEPEDRSEEEDELRQRG